MATYAVRTVAGDLLVIPALQRRLLFRMIQDIMLMLNRERARREANPGVGMLDSQTAKAPHALGAATTRPTKGYYILRTTSPKSSVPGPGYNAARPSRSPLSARASRLAACASRRRKVLLPRRIRSKQVWMFVSCAVPVGKKALPQ